MIFFFLFSFFFGLFVCFSWRGFECCASAGRKQSSWLVFESTFFPELKRKTKLCQGNAHDSLRQKIQEVSLLKTRLKNKDEGIWALFFFPSVPWHIHLGLPPQSPIVFYNSTILSISTHFWIIFFIGHPQKFRHQDNSVFHRVTYCAYFKHH